MQTCTRLETETVISSPISHPSAFQPILGSSLFVAWLLPGISETVLWAWLFRVSVHHAHWPTFYYLLCSTSPPKRKRHKGREGCGMALPLHVLAASSSFFGWQHLNAHISHSAPHRSDWPLERAIFGYSPFKRHLAWFRGPLAVTCTHWDVISHQPG